MYQHLADLMLDGYLDRAVSIAEMINAAGVLPDYPLVDQLHEPTSDGLADENARMNCVFASFASAVKYLCRPDHQDANGDYIKDKSPAYGQGYMGGSAAETVAPTVKELYDVSTTVQRSSDRNQLLAWCIQNIDRGHPSMITMPSAWNSQKDQPGYNPNAPNFPTHAGNAFGYNPSTRELLVANPWGGFVHRGTYQYWVDRFCYQKVYDLALIGAGPMPLPTGWRDDGKTLSQDQTGFVVVKGFRQFILDQPYWPAWDVPIENEHEMPAGVPLELSNPEYGKDDDIRVQIRTRGSWLASRRNRVSQKWATGFEWVGQEADYLRKLVDQLNAKIAELEAAPHSVSAQQAIDAIVAILKEAGKL